MNNNPSLPQQDQDSSNMRIMPAQSASERRRFRRHELIGPHVIVERWDPSDHSGIPMGEIMDLSAGGVRVRTGDPTAQPGQTIQIRLRRGVKVKSVDLRINLESLSYYLKTREDG